VTSTGNLLPLRRSGKSVTALLTRYRSPVARNRGTFMQTSPSFSLRATFCAGAVLHGVQVGGEHERRPANRGMAGEEVRPAEQSVQADGPPRVCPGRVRDPGDDAGQPTATSGAPLGQDFAT
jgi:hypothetical protein